MFFDWALPMNEFPMAAVNQLLQLGFKTQQFILLEFWRPEVQNQYYWAAVRMSAGPYSLQRLQERICPLPPAASPGCQHPLTCGHIPPVSESMVSHIAASSSLHAKSSAFLL